MNKYKIIIKNYIRQLPYGKAILISAFRSIRMISYSFLLIPIIFILRVVSVFKKIRIGFILSARIGHLALDLDIYNSDRLRNQNKYRGAIDLLFTQDRIANRYLLDLWENNYKGYYIIEKKWRYSWLMVDINKRMKIYNDLYIDLQRVDLDGVTVGMPSFVHIDEATNLRCKKYCHEIGIADKYVCIHNRDSEFLNKTLPEGEDPNYHDYRDSFISNYFDASKELSKKGYAVVRVGRIAKDRALLPNIIDYAFMPSAQSDEMDIYLLANAAFTISSSTGISHIPFIFRKKQLCVNMIPFLPTTVCGFMPESVILPKKIWHTKEKRLLNFSEIMRFDITIHNTGCPYRAHYLEPVENTSEEIRDAAIEMDDRLNGRANAYDDFEELQELFWSLTPNTKGWHTVREKFRFRLGSKFLYNNREIIK